MDAGTFDTALEFAYTLAPGENLFNARIESESGELQKTFTIFLETDEVKYQDPAKARKSSFSFITIGGIVRDDNINSASSDPKAAAKSSLTLVVVKQIATGYTSAVVLTGIVNADDQWSSEYRSREILFRQFSADWNDSAFDWGDLTVGLGLNEVGLSDPRASSLRDSWNGSYKQGAAKALQRCSRSFLLRMNCSGPLPCAWESKPTREFQRKTRPTSWGRSWTFSSWGRNGTGLEST